MDNLVGFGIVLVAGILGGSVLLPMKYVREWAWENTWLLYSLGAYLSFPWLVAWVTVPNLFSTYREAGLAAGGGTALFGLGWGVAVVLFGFAVGRIGMSVSSSILFGSSVATGSLGAMFILDRSRLFTWAGAELLGCDLLMIAGVVLCARAGDLRADVPPDPRVADAAAMRTGILLCFVAGVLSTLFNIALAYGRPIQERAAAHGAEPLMAANAIWSLAVSFGSLPSLAFCGWKLTAGGSWSRYPAGRPWVNAMLCVLMGTLWISSTVLYGAAASRMGRLGPVIGWPMYMSAMILGNNAWGWFTGEWRGVTGRPVRLLWLGIAIQIVTMALLPLV